MKDRENFNATSLLGKPFLDTDGKRIGHVSGVDYGTELGAVVTLHVDDPGALEQPTVKWVSKPVAIEMTEPLLADFFTRRLVPDSELFGPNLIKQKADADARALAAAREHDLKQRMLYGDNYDARPRLKGMFDNPDTELRIPEAPDWLGPTIEGYDPDETAEGYPGGGELKAAGWQLMFIMTKPTKERPWLPWKIWGRRWEREGHATLDHARVASGRYHTRLPTNRRRKREFAKERRRARKRAGSGTVVPNARWTKVAGPDRAEVELR